MTKEEAINILRETHDNSLFSVRTALETLIPELKESEDERIRKIIIKHFEEIANRNEQSWINLDIPYILAYLEKQKEQKPAEWREEDIDASVKSYSDSLPMCGEFQSYHDALVHAYRQGMVNALKSLRPSWKPSEEQEEPEYYQHPV